MHKKSNYEKIFNVGNITFMMIFSIICLYPFIHVLFASISQPFQMMAHRGLLLYPKGITFQAYQLVFNNPSIVTSYMNTLFYVSTGTSINVFLTVLGAYVVSRKQFLLRNHMMFFMVFTMFFSGGLIPSYIWISTMGLIDTRWALIIPGAIATYNLIIVRTYFIGIPDSLEESASIDGANDFLILFKIILPVAMPVIAVITLFYGVGHWNSWFSAAIYLRNRDLYPVQLILREILISSVTESMTTGQTTADREPIGETIKYATIIIVTLPVLMIYPLLQKYFVKGIMIGAIK
ncbi:MAG: carbohydrate ABC transporter permease [Bacillota bacterium]|nr:carbohydrate ABC transporter permease [Bacillota bacterium]